MKLSIGESKKSPESDGDSPHVNGDFSHLVDGLPSFDVAQRNVGKSHWIDEALVFTRALLSQGKVGPGLVQTGVYLPQGPRQDREGDMLYVGKGYPIRSLVASHYAELGLLTPRHRFDQHHGRAAHNPSSDCIIQTQEHHDQPIRSTPPRSGRTARAPWRTSSGAIWFRG